MESQVTEPVLTLRQPWASATFHAGKDVENRPKRTHYRGRLWIHAGQYDKPVDTAREEGLGLWIPEEPLPRKVILGCVELYDCVEDSDSDWALPGQYHWLIRRPMLLVRPVWHTGQLGFSWRRPPQGRLVAPRRRGNWLSLPGS